MSLTHMFACCISAAGIHLCWNGWICYDWLQHWRWHSSINRLPHSRGADDAYALARTGRVGIRVPVHECLQQKDRPMWKPILVISLGSALGALLRWVLGTKLNSLFPTVPPGTL